MDHLFAFASFVLTRLGLAHLRKRLRPAASVTKSRSRRKFSCGPFVFENESEKLSITGLDPHPQRMILELTYEEKLRPERIRQPVARPKYYEPPRAKRRRRG
jgi:hypothetical protein